MGEPSPLPGGEPAPPSCLQPLPSLLYSWEQLCSPHQAWQAGTGHSLPDPVHLLQCHPKYPPSAPICISRAGIPPTCHASSPHCTGTCQARGKRDPLWIKSSTLRNTTGAGGGGQGGPIPMESTGLFFQLYKMKPQGYKCRCLFENINENKPI